MKLRNFLKAFLEGTLSQDDQDLVTFFFLAAFLILWVAAGPPLHP